MEEVHTEEEAPTTEGISASRRAEAPTAGLAEVDSLVTEEWAAARSPGRADCFRDLPGIPRAILILEIEASVPPHPLEISGAILTSGAEDSDQLHHRPGSVAVLISGVEISVRPPLLAISIAPEAGNRWREVPWATQAAVLLSEIRAVARCLRRRTRRATRREADGALLGA